MSETTAENTRRSPDISGPVRVAVLFGGPSSEHSVSCITAQSVLEAIDRSIYDVVPIGVTKSGQWFLAKEQLDSWATDRVELPEVRAQGSAVLFSSLGSGGALAEVVEVEGAQTLRELPHVDVVLPLFHGPFGEDGTVQGLLDLACVPYVGSGVLASAVGMDKDFMKRIFIDAGLDVGPYVAISDRQWLGDAEAAMDRVDALGYPVFVKPARAGSSVGITRVQNREELRAAIDLARCEDPKVIVEAAIIGREIECGVLQGVGLQATRTSQPGEIVTDSSHELYDFEAKYLDADAAALSCPADLPEADITLVQELAVRAFEAVGAEGLSRVDFFYTAPGTFVINEINTLPGFTPVSMYPRMWKASGVEYSDLLHELLQLALTRRVGLR